MITKLNINVKAHHNSQFSTLNCKLNKPCQVVVVLTLCHNLTLQTALLAYRGEQCGVGV